MNNSAPHSLFPYGCRRGFAMAIATLLLLLTKSETWANDLLTITVTQVGGNVVATAGGNIDLTDLTFDLGPEYPPGSIDPYNGEIILGPSDGAGITVYSGLSGPTSFGPGSGTAPSAGTGDTLGINGGGNALFVPAGYTSGNSLSATLTFDSATLASLGITPGIYTYTYGSAADAGEVVIAAPEPSTWALMLGGAALLGFCASRKLA